MWSQTWSTLSSVDSHSIILSPGHPPCMPGQFPRPFVRYFILIKNVDTPSPQLVGNEKNFSASWLIQTRQTLWKHRRGTFCYWWAFPAETPGSAPDCDAGR
mmetsp:Transcript_49813/g.97444  ORF Transcript_49813/g.97444 Transcript_49813/m.97444 type:complete len:101 (-) Transcript_49813:432-734(-)